MFIMTCWLVAYSQSSGTNSFSQWKSDKIWGVLTTGSWNNLMDELDSLRSELASLSYDQGNSIPEWAVMAFKLTDCPQWWTEYTDLRGRTIVWYNGWYLWGKDGNENDWKVYISVPQMPAHSHHMFADYNNSASENSLNRLRGQSVSLYNRDVRPVAFRNTQSNNGDDNFGYEMALVPINGNYTSKFWATSTEWGWSPIDIRDPSVKLLYCIKGPRTSTSAAQSCSAVAPDGTVWGTCWKWVTCPTWASCYVYDSNGGSSVYWSFTYSSFSSLIGATTSTIQGTAFAMGYNHSCPSVGYVAYNYKWYEVKFDCSKPYYDWGGWVVGYYLKSITKKNRTDTDH